VRWSAEQALQRPAGQLRAGEYQLVAAVGHLDEFTGTRELTAQDLFRHAQLRWPLFGRPT